MIETKINFFTTHTLKIGEYKVYSVQLFNHKIIIASSLMFDCKIWKLLQSQNIKKALEPIFS